jgi:hypothetical protein
MGTWKGNRSTQLLLRTRVEIVHYGAYGSILSQAADCCGHEGENLRTTKKIEKFVCK